MEINWKAIMLPKIILTNMKTIYLCDKKIQKEFKTKSKKLPLPPHVTPVHPEVNSLTI